VGSATVYGGNNGEGEVVRLGGEVVAKVVEVVRDFGMVFSW